MEFSRRFDVSASRVQGAATTLGLLPTVVGKPRQTSPLQQSEQSSKPELHRQRDRLIAKAEQELGDLLAQENPDPVSLDTVKTVLVWLKSLK